LPRGFPRLLRLLLLLLLLLHSKRLLSNGGEGGGHALACTQRHTGSEGWLHKRMRRAGDAARCNTVAITWLQLRYDASHKLHLCVTTP
jgi:hypothetical protein